MKPRFSVGEEVETCGNPLFDFEAADPHLLFWEGRFYIYATKAAKTEAGFAVWSSQDLKKWRFDGMALQFANVSWAQNDDWAPAILERNGRFYLYFCADSQIGVAVSDSPTGPFHDALGAPLLPFRDDISAIDPCAFTDDDGQSYLFFGAVPAFWLDPTQVKISTSLSVQKLGADLISLEGQEFPTVEYEPFGGIKNDFGAGRGHCLDHIEASMVFKRRGVYYLMFSRGNHGMGSDERAYRVRYATAQNPLGPWQIAPEVVLQTRREIGCVGPGHHGVLELPGDRWLVCYHAHGGDGFRRLWMDWMHFDDAGRILEIVPTREGASL